MPNLVTLPVLPLRDIVVFPGIPVSLLVGREKSVKALQKVASAEKQLLLVAQKDPAADEPEAEELFTVGSVAKILQMVQLPDGTVKVLVEGVASRPPIRLFFPVSVIQMMLREDS